MDSQLQQSLRRVARRLYRQQLGWVLAMIWGASAVCGLMLVPIGRSTAISDGFLWCWLGCTLLVAIIAAIVIRRRFGQWQWIARRIESHFPSLNQRLATVADMVPQLPNGQYSYLQRTVIAEALQHDNRNRWTSIISGQRMTNSWLASLLMAACLSIVAVAVFREPSRLNQMQLQTATNSSATLEMPEVQPGNSEVEIGSNVIVTAKFNGRLPDSVSLIQKTKDGEQRQAMRRSLNDPIFAAYLSNLRSAAEYCVEFDGQRTEFYQVSVFEYPSMVRADAILDYPEYTGMESKTIVDTRRVTAATGTRLTWQVHLNKPVVTARLMAIDQPSDDSMEAPFESLGSIELIANSASGLVVEGSIELTQSFTWMLQLSDSDGRNIQQKIKLSAKALPNDVAKIKLIAGGDQEVSPLQELDVAAKIQDDFGIEKAGIGYQFADGEIVEIEVPQLKTGKAIEVARQIDMESLQAEPNQLLSYYVWADDRDETGELRRSVSDMYFAEVRPLEEIFRQGEQPTAEEQQQQQQQQQQSGNPETEELVELQKQIIAGTWNIGKKARGSQLPSSTAEDIRLLADSQTSAIERLAEMAQQSTVEGAAEIIEAAGNAMEKAAEDLNRAADSFSKSDLQKALKQEQAAYQQLLRLQSREHQVVQSQRQRGQQSSRRSRARQQQLDELELKQEQNRYENERLASQEQDLQQSELRQVISRLRELATRQEDINEQLREVEAALQAAKTEKEREELQQQLERLREQQQQLLQDSDELRERMEAQQNSEPIQNAQTQLQEARENIQQSSDALNRGNTGQALAAGARAEQQLEQLQDDLRQQAANQFSETMQDMRQRASDLEQTQKEIVDQLARTPDTSDSGLRAQQQDSTAAEKLADQREKVHELLQDMEKTVQQAEDAEPLLAQRLYDSYRRAQQQKIENRLKETSQLMQRNLDTQARGLATQSVSDLGQLKSEIDQAAEAVLGNETDSLELALSQIKNLQNAVDRELQDALGAEQTPSATQSEGSSIGNQNQSQDQARTNDLANKPSEDGSTPPGDQPGQNGQPQNPNQPGSRRGQAGATPSQTAESRQPDQQDPSQQSQSQQGQAQQPGQSQEGQEGGREGQSQPGRGQQANDSRQANSDANGRPNAGLRGLRDQAGTRNGGVDDGTRSTPELFGGDIGNRPFTGEDFRAWSDRLRDVEELVNDPDLRWQATQIRQAARDLRSEAKKHAADPKWELVKELVANPLRELERRVSEELIRRAASKNEIVPIDRDPVPSEFSRSVREYYENLGSGR